MKKFLKMLGLLLILGGCASSATTYHINGKKHGSTYCVKDLGYCLEEAAKTCNGQIESTTHRSLCNGLGCDFELLFVCK